MERYDIAIIGSGPAGLEAAITAKVRNKNVLLIGSNNLSSKVEKAHLIRNYLGLNEVTGLQMQEKFLEHLKALDIKITEERVNTVYAMGDYFAIQGHKDMYEARTVILACGISAAKPLPGELENLGKGVSYCATCDASLYKGKKTVVIGYSQDEEKEAQFLSELAKEVIYLPIYQMDADSNGNVKLRAGGNIKVLNNANPVSIERVDKKVLLNLDGESIETDGLFILRESVAPSQLVPGLKIENNQVDVNRKMETNIAGLFACGDITGAPYQYIKAAGEGNVAALSAVNYLANASR